MPLLLLLSGYLARSKIRAGLQAARTRLAIVTNLHIYVVWTLIFFALGVLFYPNHGVAPFDTFSVTGLGLSLLYPRIGPLWFVYVLFVSIAALALTRRMHPAAVLAGFFAVGWAIMTVTGEAAGLPRAVFFAAGALVGEALVELTDSRLATVLALVGYGALTAVTQHMTPAFAYPLTVLAGLCAAVAFLAIAKVVSRLRVLREPGAWVGRRTLGIYVLHWPLVALLTWVGVDRTELFDPWIDSQIIEVLYPIAVTAVIILLCLGLEALLKRVGLGVLFDPPTFVKDRITRGPCTMRTFRHGTPSTPSTAAASPQQPMHHCVGEQAATPGEDEPRARLRWIHRPDQTVLDQRGHDVRTHPGHPGQVQAFGETDAQQDVLKVTLLGREHLAPLGR
ncbi:hypothetical protein GCM10025883_13500 [Mobilicoccus caccae]|uniref:Acyltransferase 3 domain-containing protein n=1 Tax=Mobilicoccus caccae TaxID=1859295 RepID=A0ABQ6IN25_9MICO|nr:hypothetical protein GCM10025883_13500 [Mobilicoccus caccae]